MDQLAGVLSFRLNRPAVDRTGVSGRIDLGLKLEPARTSLRVLVIDHVERPTPN